MAEHPGPDETEGFREQIRVLGEQGKWAEALPILDEWVSRYPSDPTGWYNKALAQNRLGALQEAEKALLRALELKPDYPKATAALRRVCAKLAAADTPAPDRPTDPLSDLEIDDNARRAEQLLKDANLQRIRKDLDAAIARAKAAQRLDRTDPEIPLLLGEIYYQRKDFEEARQCVDEALSLKPDLVRAIELDEKLRRAGRSEARAPDRPTSAEPTSFSGLREALAQVLGDQERAARAISNVRMREEAGALSPSQAERERADHSARLEDAEGRITSLYERVGTTVKRLRADREVYADEIARLEGKRQEGGFAADEFIEARQETQARIDELDEEIEAWERLLSASSADELEAAQEPARVPRDLRGAATSVRKGVGRLRERIADDMARVDRIGPDHDATSAKSLMDNLVNAIPASFHPANLLVALTGMIVTTIVAAPFMALAQRQMKKDAAVSTVVFMTLVGVIIYVGTMVTYAVLCRRGYAERSGVRATPGEALAVVGRHLVPVVVVPFFFRLGGGIAVALLALLCRTIAETASYHAAAVTPLMFVLFVGYAAYLYVDWTAHLLLPAGVAVESLSAGDAWSLMGGYVRSFRRVLSYQTIVAVGLVPLAVVTFVLTVPALAYAVSVLVPGPDAVMSGESASPEQLFEGFTSPSSPGAAVARSLLTSGGLVVIPILIMACCCLVVYLASSQTVAYEMLRDEIE